jgi:hypothetical protein
VFYYADEFNLSWLPTLRAMWSPKGQQVMIKTPGHQQTSYGIGAVNYYTGETVVQFQQLYLPTYSPWLNPIEMLWRHFRREVTHCELFQTMQALLTAAQDCFDRFNQFPGKILSVIGSHAAKVI